MNTNHCSEVTVLLTPSHSALCLSFSICRRQNTQKRFLARDSRSLYIGVGPKQQQREVRNPGHRQACCHRSLYSHPYFMSCWAARRQLEPRRPSDR